LCVSCLVCFVFRRVIGIHIVHHGLDLETQHLHQSAKNFNSNLIIVITQDCSLDQLGPESGLQLGRSGLLILSGLTLVLQFCLQLLHGLKSFLSFISFTEKIAK